MPFSAEELLTRINNKLGYDDTVGALITIDTVHHEVHEGEMFTVEHSASVTNTNSLDILFTIGNKTAHTGISVSAGGQITGYLYEAPTASGGTALTIYNMNRTSSNVSEAIATHTPTVSATGSVALINGRVLPGGATNQTRVGGSARTGAEWILKSNTKYLLRITNTSGGTIVINPVIEFYEEE